MVGTLERLLEGPCCMALGEGQRQGLSYSPQDRNVHFEASLPN